jgi:hypothetical protein
MEQIMRIKQKILVAVMGMGLAFFGAASASAGTWQDNHPRRVEVNHRLAHQNFRINRDLREGRITVRQAAVLHRQDRMIRFRERRDAALNGGHITRFEQAHLNHQENGVSRHIYRAAH